MIIRLVNINGNLITDNLNSNFSIHYDHRNLITDLIQRVILVSGITPADTSFYKTYYYYDEAGNRIRKRIFNDENDSLLSDIIYSRDVSGKEMAIYENESIKQWNIWGTDNAGFINANGDKRFYLKDHLGSVRAVLDEFEAVISSQDYDVWGYQLQDRNYDSDVSLYMFTSKERDEESEYDYFGARYYDARIANWGSVDPLLEKHYDYSPYNYVLRNPLKLVDPDGRQVEIITRTYIPQESSVNPLYKVFHDNRSADYYSNSYRTEQRMIVVPNENVISNIVTSFSNDIGKTWAISTSVPFDLIIAQGEGKLSTPKANRVSETSVNVSITGKAWETLPPAILPSIDYSINYNISENNDGTYNIIATGTEDGFPAYEIWARNLKTGGKPILIYNRENESAYELPKLIDNFYDVNFRREEILR